MICFLLVIPFLWFQIRCFPSLQRVAVVGCASLNSGRCARCAPPSLSRALCVWAHRQLPSRLIEPCSHMYCTKWIRMRETMLHARIPSMNQFACGAVKCHRSYFKSVCGYWVYYECTIIILYILYMLTSYTYYIILYNIHIFTHLYTSILIIHMDGRMDQKLRLREPQRTTDFALFFLLIIHICGIPVSSIPIYILYLLYILYI